MRKKKIVSSMRLARMATMLILALLAVQTAQADTWDGTTRTQPTKTVKYENYIESYSFIDINCAAELAYICEHWNEEYDGKYYYQWDYKLMVDIDMGDWSWTTLGNKALLNDSYDGTFDGDGHTIRINISGATDNYQGLFAKISSDGKVENLHVSGNIHCSTSRLVGGIAGENDGTISNCWVSADVRSDWREPSSAYTAKVGGIAGENNGTVKYCCMTGNVKNDDADVGGLVGDNSGATISHCTFYGSVSSSHGQDNKYAGDSGTENSCFDSFNQDEYDAASGNDMYRNALLKPYVINISTLGEGTYVAKIGESTVTRAYPGQTITLTKTSEKALYSVTIKDADGNTISSTGDMNDHLEISMPRRDVNVTAVFYTTDWDSETLGTEENPYIIDKNIEWDKFVNKVNDGTTFSGKYVKLTANITVDNMAGCMDGDNRRSFNGHFDGGGNTINCQIEADKLDAAPFCYTQDATFKDLTLTGSVTITGDDYVKLGGIVAYATGTTTFTNCKVSTTLTASVFDFAGGFVGKAESANFENCTFDGKLLGGNGNALYCGGFEGYAVYSTTLNNCLFKPSEATITANELRTFVCGSATFNNCYYTQALGTAQGKWVYVTEPSHGFYAPITLYDSNTYYLVIGTEGESGGAKTYQITEDTDINSRIIVKGTVALTLDEGKTLHARRGIELSADNNANLTINGPGALTIDGCNEEKSGIGAKKVGTLVIKGGTLNVRGGKYAAGIGGDYYNTGGGSITINGGVVNAWGGYGSAGIGGGYGYNFTSTCGDIVINGGQVTAIGYWVYGIGPGLVYSNNEYHSGTLTLNLSNQDDFVYVNESDHVSPNWSLNTITIASGKTLYDEDGVEHTSSNVGDIYGKTLRPYDYRLTLNDNADNSAAIAAAANANGKVYNVTLSGRTLSKSGEWNTLCLPFNVSAEQMTATTHPLYGAIIKELNATTSNLASDGTLTLNFTTASSIEAGKPYIVKWEGASGSVSNPVFTNVIIDATAPTPVTFANNANAGGDCKFVGQYSPFSIVASGATGNDQGNLNEILMLGSGSTLGYSKNPRTLKTFRCHFFVPANEPVNENVQAARAFVLDFGDGSSELTGIISITADQRSTDGSTYTLDGRKLNGKPTAKGVYIQNGRKVVIK